MIPAATGPQLLPSEIAQPAGHTADRPVLVHHRMLGRLFPGASGTKQRPALQGAVERSAVGWIVCRHNIDRQIGDRQLNPAGDINPNAIRDDSIIACQDTADRESVTDVSVRHQGGRHRNRQAASVSHLLVGGPIEIDTPAGVVDRILQTVAAGRLVENRLGQRRPDRIVQERLRLANQLRNHLLWLATCPALAGSDLNATDGDGHAIGGHSKFNQLATVHKT